MESSDTLVLLGVSTWLCLALSSCAHSSVKADEVVSGGAPVRVAVSAVQDVPIEIAAVGNVEPVNSVEVKSRVAGQIGRVAFEEGQSVAKGQLLFTIDRDVLQHQAAEQQADLERDIAMEQQARAVMARDAASQKQSQSEADTALELARDGILSKQRTGQLVTTGETARAAFRSDQAAVAAAAGTAKADRARLAQTQLQMSFTDIVAPIAGRAGAVTVKAGNVVRDSDATLVTLLQISPIYVTFGIPEQSLPEVQRLNAKGELTVEATNGDGATYTGGLSFIDNTVDAATGTIKLKAMFPNAGRELWPGQFVNVRLRLRVDHGRTVVPGTAIQEGLDGKYVWLVQSGIATTRPVTVVRTYKPEGSSSENESEEAVIGNGLGPGATVVTEGQLRLTSGARVTVLDAPQQAPSRPSFHKH